MLFYSTAAATVFFIALAMGITAAATDRELQDNRGAVRSIIVGISFFSFVAGFSFCFDCLHMGQNSIAQLADGYIHNVLELHDATFFCTDAGICTVTDSVAGTSTFQCSRDERAWGCWRPSP